jgi:y4mF family transcriptional regulator
MKKIENDISTLGKTIKRQRVSRNLSQNQLAQLAGVSLNLISQIESGKPRVQFIKLLQVLNALGLQLHVEFGSTHLVIDKKLIEQEN